MPADNRQNGTLGAYRSLGIRQDRPLTSIAKPDGGPSTTVVHAIDGEG